MFNTSKYDYKSLFYIEVWWQLEGILKSDANLLSSLRLQRGIEIEHS